MKVLWCRVVYLWKGQLSRTYRIGHFLDLGIRGPQPVNGRAEFKHSCHCFHSVQAALGKMLSMNEAVNIALSCHSSGADIPWVTRALGSTSWWTLCDGNLITSVLQRPFCGSPLPIDFKFLRVLSETIYVLSASIF